MINKVKIAYYKFMIRRNERTIHNLRVGLSSHYINTTEKSLYRKHLNKCEQNVKDLNYKISLLS